VALSYLEACVVGLLQGVTELVPVSSLGHSVLLPALIGGSWARDLSVGATESPYLAFLVGLHVATAAALLVFFRRDWVRIITGLLTSLRDRRIDTPDQRLGWLLVLGTVPVGLVGLLFEHTFRTTFGTPRSAAAFLTLNGLLLLGGEALRRRAVATAPRPAPASAGGGRATAGTRPGGVAATESPPGVDTDLASDRRLAGLGWLAGLGIGATQIAALFAGISRSGVAMTAGLLRGLSHEDAARLSFLLATPVILAAGVLKIPDLFGPLGKGILGQVLAGSVLSGLGAYVAVRFLTRWFATRTLTPFAVYCLIAGGLSLLRFGVG